ncbi:MAG TPA: 4Fe-4S binding protein [Candidatus Bathyarchaeota archaeon]|nr:4Fe-4S binding protein [Candidatus Bathyarchaeota archaeon]
MKVGLVRFRRLLQLIGLFLANLGILGLSHIGFVYPYLYCYACPFSILGCPFGVLQNMMIVRAVPFLSVGGLFSIYLFSGRFFCGWICPIGLLTEVFHKTERFVNGKLFKIKVKIASPPKPLTFVKYGVLVVSLIVAYMFKDTYFCKGCIAGFLVAGIPYRLRLHIGLFSGLTLTHPFTIHIIIFIVIFILSLSYLGKFWCRFICPVGAMAGILNNVSLLRLEYDKSKCTGCMLCVQACPMAINPTELDAYAESDCIRCGSCVDACPSGSLRLSFKPSLK